jgi:hypothetical protein
MRFFAFVCVLGVAASASAQSTTPNAAQYTNIVAPNAAAGTTVAEYINAAGTIAGGYQDASSMYHGFERTAQGAYTTIDPPGARFTAVTALNAVGAIAGFYSITDFGYPPRYRGFVRSRAGVFATFAALGESTSPRAMSPSGVVTGNYFDVNDPNTVAHGFVRASDGTITTFDAPGAGTGPGYGFPIQQGTFPNSINRAGAISGYFVNAVDPNIPIAHGFIRAADGTFTTFDFPGAGSLEAGEGTFPMGIDDAGDVAGYWVAVEVPSGFLRTADGTLTNIAAPGGGSISVTFMSPTGEILGSVGSPTRPAASAGFIRSVDGKMAEFACPGAYSTQPYGINAKGQIVGLYKSPNGSFLLVP